MNPRTKIRVREILFPSTDYGHPGLDDEEQYDKIEENYDLSSDLLELIEREDVLRAERYLFQLRIKSTKTARILLKDAEWLLEYLDQNKTPRYRLNLQKLFLSKSLKKNINISKEIKYAGKPCNTKERLKIAAHYLFVLTTLEQVNIIWNIPDRLELNDSLIEHYYFARQINSNAREIKNKYRKGNSVLDYLTAKEIF